MSSLPRKLFFAHAAQPAAQLTAPATTRHTHTSALILGGYTLAAIALLWRTWLHPTTHLAGAGGDLVQQFWATDAAAYSIVHGISPFYTHLLNYPHGINLLWAGSIYSLAPLFALFNWLSGPVVAYNALLVVIFALNAWCGYLACRRWARHRSAAIIGGFLFGFSPAVIAQSLDHPFLAAVFFLPLALICLDKLAVEQAGSPKLWGLALGLVAAGQFYTAEEVWATMGLLSAIGLAWLALLNWNLIHGHLHYLITGLSWAAATMALLITGPLLFQFFGPGAVSGSLLLPKLFSGSLVGFLAPTWLQALNAPPLLWLSGRADFTLVDFGVYIGLPVIIALVWLSWRRWQNHQVRFLLGWIVIVAILILGPTLRLLRSPVGLPLPGAILRHIPLLGNYLPSRLDVYLDLGLALLLTIFLDQITRQKAGRALRLLAILVVASWLPTLSNYPSEAINTPAFFSQTHFTSSGSVLIVPLAISVSSDQGMLWQAIDGLRFSTPDGYFSRVGGPRQKDGPVPTLFTNAIWKIQNGGSTPAITVKLKAEANDYLAQHRVQTTVLGPMEYRPAMRRWLTLVFGRQPVVRGGVDIWYGKPNA